MLIEMLYQPKLGGGGLLTGKGPLFPGPVLGGTIGLGGPPNY